MREIYNAPFSLCLKDGIPVDMCHKISLLFGGKTFQGVFYNSELAKKNESYFFAITMGVVKTLTENYFLSPYPKPKYGVPTLGQLKYMLDNNYVRKITGQGYWYRRPNGSVKRTYYGARPGYNVSPVAMLTRVVAPDFPSSCEEEHCEGFYNTQNWTLQTASNSAFTMRYAWGFTFNGKEYSKNESRQQNLSIPGSAVNVWIDVWHAGMLGYVARYQNLEDRVGTSDVLCVKIFGSLVVNHAEIYRKRCW